MRSMKGWAAVAACMGLLVFTVGCGKKDDEGSGGGGSAEATGGDSTGGESAGTPEAPATGGKEIYKYPPPGDGPHQGFDLAAIRSKLQGTWMVGGAAFSSIPNIWHISGDEMIKIDGKGNKTEHTIELLAPCYARVADKGGSSAEYNHFVFDGDTLYAGLGNAGVIDGDKTLGCMSASMYTFEGGTCTKWNKKSFPREGEPKWEKEDGECGYEEDGNVFWADDTNSSRKIYGKQTLKKVGGALMTQQMEGNKAEKMDSLDAAIAKQKELLDAKDALTKIPADLPFKDWNVPAAATSYAKGDSVWIAGVSRDGKWTFNVGRWNQTEGDVVWVKQMSDLFAPGAFTRKAEPATLKAGQPVMIAAGAFVSYGRYKKNDGDKVVIEHLSARQVRERTVDGGRVAPVPAKTLTLGTPVAYKDGDMWKMGNGVAEAGDQIYVVTGDGVKPLPKADVKVVDGAKVFKKGAKVMVMQPSGMSPLKYVPGKVDKVLGNGVAYEVKTDDGKVYQQGWNGVMAQ